MTEPVSDNLPQPIPAKRRSGLWKLFAVILVLGLAFFTLAPWVVAVLDPPPPPHASVAVSGERDAVQGEIDQLKNRVQNLEAKLNAVATAPATALADSAALTHMQNDMVSLSSAMTALQSEVKASGETAAEARATLASQIAEVVAYIQLRDAAATGRSFAEAFATMHDASKNDAELQPLLLKLQPYTAGVPTLTALQDDLLQRQPAVAVAIAKGAAQNWWERILAALRGLITVRPVHGGEGDALANVETSLADGNIAAALDAFKLLPKDAQSSLGDWQKNLEARQEVEASLHDIAAHFTNMPAAANP